MPIGSQKRCLTSTSTACKPCQPAVGWQVRAYDDPARGEIQIVTSDTGCGIATENLARALDPYFTTKPEGSGLGLAMAQKIIDEHEGKMAMRAGR